MAEHNEPRRKRSGSHFATPGSGSHVNWGSDKGSGKKGTHARRSHSSSHVVHTAAGSVSGSDHLSTTSADELNPYDSAAPRAVPASSTSSFDTLSPGEGAVVTTRDTAAEAADAARNSYLEQGTGSMRLTGKNRPKVESHGSGAAGAGRIAVIVILVAILFVGAVFVFRNILNQPAQEEEEASTLVSEDQVDVGEDFEYNGYTYSVTQQGDGTYALVRESGGDTLVLMQLTGTPATLIFSNGVFYVPESTETSWDIMCYTLGDGSMPTQYVDADGNTVGGDAALDSVTYEDGVITLTDVGGNTTMVDITSD
jgi:hypothetical protein